MVRILFLLFFTNISFSEEIACSDQSCSFSSGIIDYTHVEKIQNHNIQINDYMEDSISIIKPLGEDPKNLKLSVNFVENDKNAQINLFSNSIGINAADIIMFSNQVNNLSIMSDGYDGIPRSDAAKVCAERIKRGDYGQVILDNFNNRRIGGQDDSFCVEDDILDLQNLSFSCDEISFSDITSSGTFDIVRWKERQACFGGQTTNLCLERKVDLTCSWDSVGSSECCNNTGEKFRPPGGNWECKETTCSPSEKKTGWRKVFRATIDESDYLQNSENRTDNQICDHYFPRDRTQSKDNQHNTNDNVIIDFPGECKGDACTNNAVDLIYPSVLSDAKIVNIYLYPGNVFKIRVDAGTSVPTVRADAPGWFNYPENREALFRSINTSYRVDLLNNNVLTGIGMCPTFPSSLPKLPVSGINYKARGYKIKCLPEGTNAITCRIGGGFSDASDCSNSPSAFVGFDQINSDDGDLFSFFIEYEIVDLNGYVYSVIQYANLYAD